jgi:hypothetical protein
VPLAPSRSFGEDIDDGMSEAESIQEMFGGKLSDGWGVIYRPKEAFFLCHDWAHRRLFTGKDALKPGKWTFKGKLLGDLTDEDVNTYSAYLKRDFNLVKCDMDDEDRVSFEQPSGALPTPYFALDRNCLVQSW